jgi:hypothetical protein
MLSTLKYAVNKSLAPILIRITRVDSHDWNDVANFIPFKQTTEKANMAGMSIGDYVDAVMNGVPGMTQDAINIMASLGVFSKPIGTVVEIGPGTGQYLEKTLKAARPSRYEIYETAAPWSAYLVKTYNVTSQPTNGYALTYTADSSADMVQAHKVFSTVPFQATCCYWHEMSRVIGPGGWAVFDVVTERCLAGDTLRIWAESAIRWLLSGRNAARGGGELFHRQRFHTGRQLHSANAAGHHGAPSLQEGADLKAVLFIRCC